MREAKVAMNEGELILAATSTASTRIRLPSCVLVSHQSSSEQVSSSSIIPISSLTLPTATKAADSTIRKLLHY